MDELKLISPAGEYYLHSVREMGSGFRLKADHTFEFFVSYGALDRYGIGTWRIEGNIITFNSRPWNGKDFALLESKTTNDKHVSIIVKDRNPNILRYVFATINNQQAWQ